MQKEIKYSGYTAQPSDYECQDGELDRIVNLVPEDGQLKPVFSPTEQFSMPSGYDIVFIHKTAAYTHYIVKTDAGINNVPSYKLYWIDKPSEGTELTSDDFIDSGTGKNLMHLFGSVGIHEVNAIGNTLVVLATDGMHYLLWKDDAYKYLGTHLPELPISFGLQGGVEHSDVFQLSSDTSARRTKLYAEINKFISEQHSSGKFLFPFFVRYAYRLYDNTSMVMQSAPVLMVASAGVAPNVIGGVNDYVEVVAVASQLDYLVEDATLLTQLNEWSDIVASVDIFVSAPIYTYNQNDEDWDTASQSLSTDEVDNDMRKTFSVYKQTDQNKILFPIETYPIQYQKRTLLQSLIFECGHKDGNTMKIYSHARYINNYIKLPRKSEGKVKEELRDCSTFYLLRSLKLNELATSERTIIEITDDYLQTLTSRETLTDDYNSHDLIIPQRSFVYNSRLNIANITRTLYNGYPSKSIVQHTDGFVKWYSDDTPPTFNNNISGLQVFIYINQDGKNIIVTNTYEEALAWMSKPLYIFYPNANAYKAVLRMSNVWDRYYELPLERHNFLNGAFYFNGWDEPSDGGPIPDVTPDRTVAVPNKIYTSVVNNPFYFPFTGINTIGTGKILGICAAVKAMSQGQYGQFPLYAFTDEGVWTLEVAKDGTFGQIPPPVTRDVCINTNSITQLDSSVLFATDRGIMMLSGSQSVCISETLDSIQMFNASTLPSVSELMSLAEVSQEEIQYIPFREFIADCRMSYDYKNQRIIIFNPQQKYAYIYSLKSKQWGMMRSNIMYSINSYPDAIAVAYDTRTEEGAEPRHINTIQNLSEQQTEQGVKGLLITRPIKLDDANVLKSVESIIQRGYFKKGHVKSILYGSRDLFNWFLVWSSQDHYLRGFSGTPYKYYRIALICDFDKDESIFGCSIQYTPRLTNKQR